MTFLESVWFWLAKAAAEVLTFFLVFGAFVAVAVAIVLYYSLRDWLARRRATHR